MNNRIIKDVVDKVYKNIKNLQEKNNKRSQKKYNKRNSHKFYLGGYGYQENPKNDFFDFTGAYNDYEGSGGNFDGIEEDNNIDEKKDQNKDGKNDFDDVQIARMLASGMSKKEIEDQHPGLFEESVKELDDFVELLHEKKKRKKKRKKRKKSKKKKTRTKPTPGETRYRAQKYGAPPKSKRAKGLARAAAAYRRGDVKAAARIRDRMEKGERKKKTFKNVPRSDTGLAEMKRLDRDSLRELIEEIKEFELLENFMYEMDLLEDVDESIILERKKRRKKKKRKSKKKKKAGGLSAAVKKSLDKKADRRCLTRGSVYSEFRKGLAAYLSSGSRKGMSAHQWAHARVNSANPSKSWATVKKRKVCPKKKKKK